MVNKRALRPTFRIISPTPSPATYIIQSILYNLFFCPPGKENLHVNFLSLCEFHSHRRVLIILFGFHNPFNYVHNKERIFYIIRLRELKFKHKTQRSLSIKPNAVGFSAYLRGFSAYLSARRLYRLCRSY